MHLYYSRMIFRDQLNEIIEDPQLALMGVRIVKEEGFSFFLVIPKMNSNLKPVVRFDCTGYDLVPPLVDFVHPVTFKKLQAQYWPDSTVQDHQLYGQAICLAGTRGFHDHQGHQREQESFDNYRNSLRLINVVKRMKEKIDGMSFPGGGPYEQYNC